MMTKKGHSPITFSSSSWSVQLLVQLAVVGLSLLLLVTAGGDDDSRKTAARTRSAAAGGGRAAGFVSAQTTTTTTSAPPAPQPPATTKWKPTIPSYTLPPKPTRYIRPTMTRTISVDFEPPPRVRHPIIFLPAVVGNIAIYLAGSSSVIAALTGHFPVLPLQASRMLLLFEVPKCSQSIEENGSPFPVTAFPGLHLNFDKRNAPAAIDFFRGGIVANISAGVAFMSLLMLAGWILNYFKPTLAEQEDGGIVWKAATAAMFPSSLIVIESLFLEGTIFQVCSLLMRTAQLAVDLPVAIFILIIITLTLGLAARSVRRLIFVDRVVRGYTATADVVKKEEALSQMVRSSVAATFFYGRECWHGGRGLRSTPTGNVFGPTRDGAKLPPNARRVALLFKSFRPPKATTITLSDIGQLFVGHYFFFECLISIIFGVFQSLTKEHCAVASWGMMATCLVALLVSIFSRPHIVAMSQLISDAILLVTVTGFTVNAVKSSTSVSPANVETLRNISDVCGLLGVAVIMFAAITAAFSSFAMWVSGGRMVPDRGEMADLYNISRANSPVGSSSRGGGGSGSGGVGSSGSNDRARPLLRGHSASVTVASGRPRPAIVPLVGQLQQHQHHSSSHDDIDDSINSAAAARAMRANNINSQNRGTYIGLSGGSGLEDGESLLSSSSAVASHQLTTSHNHNNNRSIISHDDLVDLSEDFDVSIDHRIGMGGGCSTLSGGGGGGGSSHNTTASAMLSARATSDVASKSSRGGGGGGGSGRANSVGTRRSSDNDGTDSVKLSDDDEFDFSCDDENDDDDDDDDGLDYKSRGSSSNANSRRNSARGGGGKKPGTSPPLGPQPGSAAVQNPFLSPESSSSSQKLSGTEYMSAADHKKFVKEVRKLKQAQASGDPAAVTPQFVAEAAAVASSSSSSSQQTANSNNSHPGSRNHSADRQERRKSPTVSSSTPNKKPDFATSSPTGGVTRDNGDLTTPVGAGRRTSNGGGQAASPTGSDIPWVESPSFTTPRHSLGETSADSSSPNHGNQQQPPHHQSSSSSRPPLFAVSSSSSSSPVGSGVLSSAAGGGSRRLSSSMGSGVASAVPPAAAAAASPNTIATATTTTKHGSGILLKTPPNFGGALASPPSSRSSSQVLDPHFHPGLPANSYSESTWKDTEKIGLQRSSSLQPAMGDLQLEEEGSQLLSPDSSCLDADEGEESSSSNNNGSSSSAAASGQQQQSYPYQQLDDDDDDDDDDSGGPPGPPGGRGGGGGDTTGPPSYLNRTPPPSSHPKPPTHHHHHQEPQKVASPLQQLPSSSKASSSAAAPKGKSQQHHQHRRPKQEEKTFEQLRQEALARSDSLKSDYGNSQRYSDGGGAGGDGDI